MVNKLSSGAAPYTPATLAANTAAQNAAQNTSFNISAAQGGDTKAIAALSAQGIPVAQVGEGVYTRTYVGNDVNTAYSRAQSGGSNYSLTYSNQAADNLAQQDTKTQLQNAAQKATTYSCLAKIHRAQTHRALTRLVIPVCRSPVHSSGATECSQSVV